MLVYAKVIDAASGRCEVGTGDPEEILYVERDPDTGETKNVKVKDFYISLGMTEIEVEKAWNGSWYLPGMAPVPPEKEVINVYENAVQAHLDATAQSRDYDNTYTCLSYLSSTDETWNREANIFNAWRDAVWRKCHEVLNAVMAGEIAPPTVDELIAQLPTINW